MLFADRDIGYNFNLNWVYLKPHARLDKFKSSHLSIPLLNQQRKVFWCWCIEWKSNVLIKVQFINGKDSSEGVFSVSYNNLILIKRLKSSNKKRKYDWWLVQNIDQHYYYSWSITILSIFFSYSCALSFNNQRTPCKTFNDHRLHCTKAKQYTY